MNRLTRGVGIGMSAALFAAGCASAEAGPGQGLGQNAIEADAGPYELDLQVIEVLDPTVSPEAARGSNEAANLAYPQLTDMVERGTLGRFAITSIDRNTVTVDENVGEALCEAAAQGEDSWWQSFDALKGTLLKEVNSNSDSEAPHPDVRIFTFSTVETCNPSTRQDSNGNTVTADAWASESGDIDVFSPTNASDLFHEIAHQNPNMRLGHAAMLMCAPNQAMLLVPPEGCSISEYADAGSVMSNHDVIGDPDPLNGLQLQRIGAIEGSQVATVETPGTHTISLESLLSPNDTGFKLIRIKHDGEQWVEEALGQTDPRDLAAPADAFDNSGEEAWYAELSTQIDPVCAQGGEYVAAPGVCEPTLAIKLFRAPVSYAVRDGHVLTAGVDITGSMHGGGNAFGSTREGMIFRSKGMEISLDQPIQDNGDGTGVAPALTITLP